MEDKTKDYLTTLIAVGVPFAAGIILQYQAVIMGQVAQYGSVATLIATIVLGVISQKYGNKRVENAYQAIPEGYVAIKEEELVDEV